MKKYYPYIVGILILCGFAVVSPTFAQEAEKQIVSGRTYYIDASGKKENPALLVWCHPSGGNAKPEFDWWKSAGITAQNTVLLCPQSKARLWSMKNDSGFIEKLISKIAKDHAIDSDKILLGGHSSGAVFTYEFGLKHPKIFRALVPACGLMTQRPPKAKSENNEVLIYHSTNDTVFPFAKAKAAAKILEQRGYKITFTTDSLGHSIGPKLLEMVKDFIQQLHIPKEKEQDAPKE